jgi:hypothetical protein
VKQFKTEDPVNVIFDAFARNLPGDPPSSFLPEADKNYLMKVFKDRKIAQVLQLLL